MASTEFGTGKSIIVLAIVVGCFAILWPKIFYPMMQAAFSMTAPKLDSDGEYVRNDRPPHLNPSNVHPRLKEKIGGTRHAERLREGKPFPHPSARHPPKPQPKAGGAMSIIMPIYTIGIVVFFLYTVLKLVFKKQPLEDKKPMVKDFHMDPEYHKYVLRDEFVQTAKPENSQTSNRPRPEKVEPQQITKEKEDYEIYQLRKRLQEMEATMERIVSHMGAVSDCIAANIHANIPPNANSASIATVPAVPENASKEKQLTEHGKLSANLISTLREENLKSCIDLSPTVESYEIIGNSYPSTPIEEIKQINLNKAQISEETISHTEDTSPNDSQLPLHQDETIDITPNHQNEVSSFDRESSVASEGSSFELLCHSRDTRSLSPTGCEDNGQKEGDFVGMGSKTDSIGSIDNISFEHFSSDGLSPDHQDISFDSFVISDTKNGSERK